MAQVIHNKTLGVSDLDTEARQLYTDLSQEKPIAVSVAKADFFRIHRNSPTPEADCSQLVLRTLKQAGCEAIEQIPGGLRIAHGRLAKVKRGPLSHNESRIAYCWLPEAYVRGMAEQAQKMLGMTPEDVVNYGKAY